MKKEKWEKWFDLSETRYNGNISDWSASVRKLRKKELVEYVAYLYGSDLEMMEKVLLLEW